MNTVPIICPKCFESVDLLETNWTYEGVSYFHNRCWASKEVRGLRDEIAALQALHASDQKRIGELERACEREAEDKLRWRKA